MSSNQDALEPSAQDKKIEELEAECARLREQLARERRRRISLLRGVTHDIHNLLTPIGCTAEMLLMVPQQEQKWWLGKIHLAVRKCTELTSNILLYQRIASGKSRVQKRPCSIKAMFATFAHLFDDTKENVHFSIHLSEEFPDQVMSDENHLERILLNLIWNAFKFTKSGAVSVYANYSEEQQVATFVVEDTGRGIPPEDQTKIFKSFYQVSNEDIDQGGFGLGLKIVIELVEMLDGDIAIDSTLGVGTKFSVEIPLSKTFTETQEE